MKESRTPSIILPTDDNLDEETKRKLRQCWSTPDEEYNPLNEIARFEFDLAASNENTKCDLFLTEEEDALSFRWTLESLIRKCRVTQLFSQYHQLRGVCWLNPPYNNIGPWMQQCDIGAKNGLVIWALIPNSRGTKWYHEIILPAKESGYCRTAIRKGRIAFDDPFALKRTNPKQDNMLVIWEPPLPAPWRFD